MTIVMYKCPFCQNEYEERNKYRADLKNCAAQRIGELNEAMEDLRQEEKK